MWVISCSALRFVGDSGTVELFPTFEIRFFFVLNAKPHES
jgi:hypothetical protein